MSKINHIHLYRNGVVLDNRKAAESRLKEFASGNTYTDLDGVAILARYRSEKNTNDILTLVGIMYEDQSGAKSITIIDVEDLKSDAKVEVDALKKAVDDLKGNPSTSTSGDTSVEGAKKYTDGKIAELDVTDEAEENKYVSSVSETDGKITVSRTAIPIVGVTDTKENDKFVTSIKLEGNIVKAERAQITSSQVSREATTSITGVTVEAALKEVKDSSKVTLSSTTPSDGTSSVLKKYTLYQNGEEIGGIDIPKDLVVTSGSVVKGTWSGNVFTEVESGKGTALKLVIANQTEPVYINTLDLVKDHVGGNGISISDTNEISIRIADGNEGNFLKLDAGGLKLEGVDAAIKKSATVVEKKADDAHITVTSRTEDGHVVYAIGSVNIASADSITAETETRKVIEGQSGDTYTANTGATYISGATSMNDADVKLDEAIKNLSSSVGKATILAGKGISVDNTPTNGTKVSVKLVNEGSGLELTENGLSINLSEITLDCGTYDE